MDEADWSATARPVKALREVVVATRALLSGETVISLGEHVVLHEVVLEQPPLIAPPVLLGTTGRQGIALAGEIADGVLLPEGAGESMVRSVAAALPHAARVVVYAWLRMDEDCEAACECVLPTVRAWRDGGLFPSLVARSGLASAGPIEARELASVAVVGTPEDCARSVMRLYRAGASSIVLMPVGEDPSDQLEGFATEVFPLVLADALAT